MTTRFDPITFKKYTSTEKSAYLELIRSIDKEIDKIKTLDSELEKIRKLNNCIYKYINNGMWSFIPSDTRFPGYFSSLGDHALATVSIAVPLAVEVFKCGFDFASEYDSLKDLLSNERGVIEVIRLLSYLHDLGKLPIENHYLRTYEHTKSLLNALGLNGISEELARSAARHHYRQTIDEKFKPKTKLEYIVAFADKISATQERGLSGTLDPKPYKWLIKNDESNSEIIKKVLDATELERLDELKALNVPIDFDHLRKIDSKIFEASSFLNAKLCLFSLEVGGINKFITASDFKRYISGASSIIDNALDNAREKIEQILSPECVIYAKGGALLAIIPPAYFEFIKNIVLEIFENKTKVVKLKLPKNSEFELWELKYGPRIYSKGKSVKIASKRNFGSLVSKVIESLEIEDEVGEAKKIPVNRICPICYEYERSDKKVEIEDELEEVCERCYLVLQHEKEIRGEKKIILVNIEECKVRVEGEDVSTSYMRIIKRVADKLSKNLKTDPVLAEYKLKGVKTVSFAPVSTWDCIGRQHLGLAYNRKCNETYDIAFIKGDGDNFGKIKESMTSITLYRQISRMFEEAIESSIAEALAEVMLRQLKIKLHTDLDANILLELPFDIVFAGGDDFLVVLDSAFVFVFLLAFRRALQKLFGERKKDFEKGDTHPLSIVPLGVSMGIAIVKNRMPIKSTLDALNELLAKSKQKSKMESRGYGSEIFVSIKKFDSIPNLDEISHAFDGEIKYTHYPLNGKELEKFIEDLKYFVQKDVSPNWVKNVFGDITDPVDAYANLLYKLVRTEKGSKDRSVLEKIERMHRKDFKEKKYIFRHLDIADSLEIIGGRLSSAGLPSKDVMLKLLGD